MADSLVRQRDPFGVPVADPFAPVTPYVAPVGPLRAGANSIGQPATIEGMRPARDLAPYGELPGADTTGLPGSPLNTLYGVSSESYLTDDQRKLARQIQGKFDASLDSRDRALQRYGAPQLSSFVEDEALARAMSLARGLNTPAEVDDGNLTGPTIRKPSTLPASRPYTGPIAAAAPGKTGAQTSADWQRVMTGLASVAPLLFGKDAYGAFINKGLINTVKDWWGKATGTDTTNWTPEQVQQAVMQQSPGYPTPPDSMVYGGSGNAPWGYSAEGGAPYPTVSTDSFGSDVYTTPLPIEAPIEGIPDFTDPWWEM